MHKINVSKYSIFNINKNKIITYFGSILSFLQIADINGLTELMVKMKEMGWIISNNNQIHHLQTIEGPCGEGFW